jgi:hypothetical protein
VIGTLLTAADGRSPDMADLTAIHKTEPHIVQITNKKIVSFHALRLAFPVALVLCSTQH